MSSKFTLVHFRKTSRVVWVEGSVLSPSSPPSFLPSFIIFFFAYPFIFPSFLCGVTFSNLWLRIVFFHLQFRKCLKTTCSLFWKVAHSALESKNKTYYTTWNVQNPNSFLQQKDPDCPRFWLAPSRYHQEYRHTKLTWAVTQHKLTWNCMRSMARSRKPGESMSAVDHTAACPDDWKNHGLLKRHLYLKQPWEGIKKVYILEKHEGKNVCGLGLKLQR